MGVLQAKRLTWENALQLVSGLAGVGGNVAGRVCNVGGDVADGIELPPAPRLHPGQQGKHLVGHNNYVPGKSILTHKNPQQLLDDFSGTGFRLSGHKENVDFGQTIGFHVNPDTLVRTPTTWGTLHSGQKGAHIVPILPQIRRQ